MNSEYGHFDKSRLVTSHGKYKSKSRKKVQKKWKERLIWPKIDFDLDLDPDRSLWPLFSLFVVDPHHNSKSIHRQVEVRTRLQNNYDSTWLNCKNERTLDVNWRWPWVDLRRLGPRSVRSRIGIHLGCDLLMKEIISIRTGINMICWYLTHTGNNLSHLLTNTMKYYWL